MAYWTIQNLGVGNVAMIRAADAHLQIRRFQQIEMLNRVRAEVAEAYARTHARYAQIETNEAAVRSGFLSFTQDLDRIRYRSPRRAADRAAEQLPVDGRCAIDYIDAIVDYNRAQFELYVALGQPPANALARPGSPPRGVAPSGVTAANPRVSRPPASTPSGGANGAEFPAYKVLLRGQPMHASDEAMRLPARNCLVHSVVRMCASTAILFSGCAAERYSGTNRTAPRCDREPASIA